MDEQQHDQAALAVAARHALHDEELIAAFAGGDLEAGPEAERAQSLTERCSACRDLYRDVQLIDSLIRAADTAAEYGARVRAPRDFRLTVDDARRLGGPVPLRGIPVGSIRERLRTSLSGFARPLGASMATLGVVGLLFGSMTFGGGAMPGSLAIDAGATAGAAGAELGSVGVPNASQTAAGPAATEGPKQGSTGNLRNSTEFGATAASLSTVLQAGSVALLVLGLALLVIGMRGRSGHKQ